MSGRNARSANALSELLALLLLLLLLREMQEDLLERRLRDREVVETDRAPVRAERAKHVGKRRATRWDLEEVPAGMLLKGKAAAANPLLHELHDLCPLRCHLESHQVL